MDWSRRLKAAEKSRFGEVERRIEELEAETGAEIVPVVVTESHDYAFFEFRAAIIAGLVVFLAAVMMIPSIETLLRSRLWDYRPVHLVLISGGSAFMIMLIVYLLVNIPFLDRLIIPRRVMSRRVHERALRAFAETKVSHTPGRHGLLIFVSRLERRVEILPDTGLAERIEAEIWQSIVLDMTQKLRDQGLIQGVLLGIERAGMVLREHVPASQDRINLLPNRLNLMER